MTIESILKTARERAQAEGRIGPNGAVFRTAEKAQFSAKLAAWRDAGRPESGKAALAAEHAMLRQARKL